MKFNLKSFLVSILIISSFLPTFTFANEKDIEHEEFCEKISEQDTPIIEKILKAEKNSTQKEEDNKVLVVKKENTADTKKEQSRAITDGKRLERWDANLRKAKTTSQKRALDAYKKAIASAVKERRSLIEKSSTEYREELDDIMIKQSETIGHALEVFSLSVNDAFIHAQKECADAALSKTASSTFNKSIADARKALQEIRTTHSTNGETLKDLRKTRDDLFKKAETDFKDSRDQAQADLLITLN